MEFTAVIGNPPYGEKDGGANESSQPLYPWFVKLAKALAPVYVSIVMPSRWYTGGKGAATDALRADMLDDEHIVAFHDVANPRNLFPGTNIRGGVCYFLRDSQQHTGQVHFVNHGDEGPCGESLRPLRLGQENLFIRWAAAYGIAEKVKPDLAVATMANHVSARRPFGLDTLFRKSTRFHSGADGLAAPVKCYAKHYEVGYIERRDISAHANWIDAWKVMIPRANNIGTELPDDNLNALTIAPGTVCTESYQIVGATLGLDEAAAHNLAKYLRTRLVRFLHGMGKTSQDAPPATFRFVPLQKFTSDSDLDWSQSLQGLDKQLYTKYGLTEAEIKHIEAAIKPM